MPLIKDWERYFKTLKPECRRELITAMEVLMSDTMINQYYKNDFSELKYCLLNAQFPTFGEDVRVNKNS